MKILPIYTDRISVQTKQKNVNNNNVMPKVVDSSLNTPPVSMVTFGFAAAKNGEALKKLLSHNIPDLYSDIIMLEPDFVQKMLKRKLFSKPIKTIVKNIIPLEESLHPVQKQVFSLVKNLSKLYPQKMLEDIIHGLAPVHQARLRSIQKPIFDELENLALQMPEEQQQEFRKLMDVTKNKLANHPVTLDFSAREFKYQLDRINEGIKKRNVIDEVVTMKKLVKMASHLPTKTDDEYAEQILKKQKKKSNKTKILQNKSRRESDIIRQMTRLLLNSSLKDDKELNDLLTYARARIYKIPTVYSFKRKSFIYELIKITDKLEDSKLAHKMVQTAVKLPTSKENVSAFIMKAVDYSSEKIGYELINGSMGSLEHLTPRKKGGEDVLSNYALVSVQMNEDRAHNSFPRQLKKHPEIYRTAQNHINRLIELYNNGIFKKLGLSRVYITHLVSKLFIMSPEEKKLVIDLSTLKK